MKNRTNGLLSVLASITISACILLSAPAQAGGNISLPLPPLPPLVLPPIPHIKLSAPPLMVWLPTPAVYVAMDSPYPIFCHENRYYLHSNNAWYVGPGYNGPWATVHVSLLPPGLHHFHEHEWNRYQHEAHYWREHDHHDHRQFYGLHEDGRYRAQGPHQDRDDQPSRHERHGLDSYHRPDMRPLPVHIDRRPAPRGEQYMHNNRESFQTYYPRPGQDFARAKFRGDDRGHGNHHRHMSY